MPAKSVAADDVVEEIAKLEAEGHRITSVVSAGEGAYLVVSESTRRKAPGAKETRG